MHNSGNFQRYARESSNLTGHFGRNESGVPILLGKENWGAESWRNYKDT
jgi:hypothetical protein